MNKNFDTLREKGTSGITLIALVITIIVLLILAGVTIGAVLGDDGIINRAEEAKNMMEQAQKNEMEQIESLTNSLNEIFGNSENNNTVTPPEPPQDTIPPTVTVNKGTTTTSTITVSVTSKDDQSGMPSNPIYNYYIKKTADNDYTAASYTGTETSWTFTGLTQNTIYDVKVTTKDNAGNLGTGTATNIKTTTVEGTTPGLTTGNITAGTATWNKSTHKASVVLRTTTNKTIQYKIGAGGTYTPTSGSSTTAGQDVTVTNLNHNDLVYARLVDEAGNYGSEAFITILDGIEPIAPNIDLSATNIKAGDTLTAIVNHTDDQSGVNTANSKYIWNTTSGTLGTTNASWNTAKSFITNQQTIRLETSSTGTYYLHVLTTDKGGNKSENVSSAVIIKEPIFTSDEVANSSNKNDFYGNIVTNYTCDNSSAVANWKIFYAGSDFSADGKNHIYLIADDYVAVNYLPNSSAGHALNESSSYPKAAYFTNILNDYTGSASITNANVKKLNNSYFSQNFSSSNINMKSVAYMCDTDAWSVYKGTKADYAVGGPSVEMLMKSYSQKYDVDYRAKATSATGYQISNNGDSNWQYDISGILNTSDRLYINDEGKNNALAYWLASPSVSSSAAPMIVYYNGSVSNLGYRGQTVGFRPLVCLSADTKLERTPDGNYKIIIEPGSADDFANRLDKENIYGKIVTGYTCPNSAAVTNWKIFYAGNDFSADGKNHIYLIADDYVAVDYLPTSSAGNALNAQGEYPKAAYFASILNDYTGSASITDARIKKLNNSYFSQNFTSTNENMKSVAYMCDTNAWNVYKGAKADYAVGGPSIEMLMKSYSQKHKVDYRAKATSVTGYHISTNGGVTWKSTTYDSTEKLKTSDSLYVITSESDAFGYWLASPMNDGTGGEALEGVFSNGDVGYSYWSADGAGFRPLVCLSADAKLEKTSDGNYKIPSTNHAGNATN